MTAFTLDDGTTLDDGVHVLGPASQYPQFFDEMGAGVNPLQPGIFVTIWNTDGEGNKTTILGSGFTQIDGTVQVTLVGNTQYYAALLGPKQLIPSVVFMSDEVGLTPVVVNGYRGKLMSQAGYTTEGCNLIPIGPRWPSEEDRAPGGTTWMVMQALAVNNAATDAQVAQILARQRIWTCSGDDLVSWVYDYLGDYFPKYARESDTSFRNRALGILALKRNTLAAILWIAQTYYAAIQDELFTGGINSAADVAGGADTRGAADRGFQDPNGSLANPTLAVWDGMTQPQLAADYGVQILQFVVEIGTPPKKTILSAADTAGGADTQGAADRPAGGGYQLTTGAPDPRLAALVNLVKPAARQALYLVWHS